jgi:putative Mn2+ efflux pump MntP
MVVMRLLRKLQKSTILFKQGINMTDPILYLSMILGLTGMYVLISSFEDDDDDGNDDGERYIYDFEYVKV